jgi:hypothetical protein
MSESLVEATQLVDNAIQKIAGQQLVSSAEMTDLLLDIRLCLMSCETPAELV